MSDEIINKHESDNSLPLIENKNNRFDTMSNNSYSFSVISPNSGLNTPVSERSMIDLHKKKSTTSRRRRMMLVSDINIKFTKRENIDKKIIRKFKNYLKENMTIEELKGEFWFSFIKLNLFPPMKFKEGEDIIEFKSFNTKYMLWLFKHKHSVELYQKFINHRFHDIVELFTTKYSCITSTEMNSLKDYIKRLAIIFNSSELNVDDEKGNETEEEFEMPLTKHDTKFTKLETIIETKADLKKSGFSTKMDMLFNFDNLAESEQFKPLEVLTPMANKKNEMPGMYYDAPTKTKINYPGTGQSFGSTQNSLNLTYFNSGDLFANAVGSSFFSFSKKNSFNEEKEMFFDL